MFVDYLVLPRYYLVSFEIWNGCRVALWAAGRGEEEKQGDVIMLGCVNRWLVDILWGRGELGLDPVCERRKEMMAVVTGELFLGFGIW